MKMNTANAKNSLRILGIGDIHGEINILSKMMLGVVSLKPDLIVHIGDIGSDVLGPRNKNAEFATKVYSSSVKSVFSILETLDIPIYFVPGNHDLENIDYSSPLVFNCDLLAKGKLVKVSNWSIWGIGGSNEVVKGGLFSYEWTEDRVAELRRGFNNTTALGGKSVVISHAPPFGNKLDKLENEKGHCGSKELKGFFKDVSPQVVLCGHIHENSGLDVVDDYLLINFGAIQDFGLFPAKWGGANNVKDDELAVFSYEQFFLLDIFPDSSIRCEHFQKINTGNAGKIIVDTYMYDGKGNLFVFGPEKQVFQLSTTSNPITQPLSKP